MTSSCHRLSRYTTPPRHRLRDHRLICLSRLSSSCRHIGHIPLEVAPAQPKINHLPCPPSAIPIVIARCRVHPSKIYIRITAWAIKSYSAQGQRMLQGYVWTAPSRGRCVSRLFNMKGDREKYDYGTEQRPKIWIIGSTGYDVSCIM